MLLFARAVDVSKQISVNVNAKIFFIASPVEFLVLVNLHAFNRCLKRKPLSRHLINPNAWRNVFRALERAAVHAVISRSLSRRTKARLARYEIVSSIAGVDKEDKIVFLRAES